MEVVVDENKHPAFNGISNNFLTLELDRFDTFIYSECSNNYVFNQKYVSELDSHVE